MIDGMEMDAEAMRAPPMAMLERYCRCVAGAVGVLSVRVFGARAPDRDAGALALGDALQLTNILRDLAEDATFGRLYLPRELLDRHGIAGDDPAIVLRDPALPAVCRELAARAAERFDAADRWLAQEDRRDVRPALIMRGVYRRTLERLIAQGLAAARSARPPRQGGAPVGRDPPRPALIAMARVHIVGAGLAGLAAAVRLTLQGRQVALYEAAAQAGGRCRSYFDRTLGRVIDNGNHLLLSGNRSAMAYLDAIGARASLIGPARLQLPVHGPCERRALGGAAEPRSAAVLDRAAVAPRARHAHQRLSRRLAPRARRSRPDRRRLSRPTRSLVARLLGPARDGGAEHAARDRLGASSVGGAPGELCPRRCRLPAADRAREPRRQPGRAGAGAAGAARRRARLRPPAARDRARRQGAGAGFRAGRRGAGRAGSRHRRPAARTGPGDPAGDRRARGQPSDRQRPFSPAAAPCPAGRS